MVRRGIVISLIAVLILTFTGYEVSVDPLIIPHQNEKILDLGENGFGFEVGETREETIALLGEPLDRKTATVENQYYDFEDEVTDYIWSGLEVTYFKHNHPEYGWDRLVRIKVTENDRKLNYEIKIGMKKQEILKTFGDRYAQSERGGIRYLFYMSTIGEISPQIVFALKKGKLVSVAWSYLPD